MMCVIALSVVMDRSVLRCLHSEEVPSPKFLLSGYYMVRTNRMQRQINQSINQ